MKHKNVHNVDRVPAKAGPEGINVLIIIGLLFITAALSLAGYNIFTDMKASVRANDALHQMEFGADEADMWKRNPEMEMPEVEIDGIWYTGALEMPSLGLQLPVAAYWDESFAKSAPCRYTGSSYTGDMIIAGHNYRQHFGRLRSLQPGVEVYFTDMNGNSFYYTAVSVESINGRDAAAIKVGSRADYDSRDTWDLPCSPATSAGRQELQ